VHLYLFQGNTLVIPLEKNNSKANEPILLEIIEKDFGKIEETEIKTIPTLDGKKIIYTIDLPKDRNLPNGWQGIPPRQAVSFLTKTDDFMRAYHIIQWKRESIFCGSCGNKNQDDEKEVARICPFCKRREYPRISPAIIVLITNDEGKALLAHNKNFTSGMYSLIAGFNEAGENLENTVEREIFEEVGLKIKDIKYMISQPWPFPNSLMLGFTACHKEGDIKVDGVEIEDAKWFSRDNLPMIPAYGSVSRYLIDLWLEEKL